MIGAASVGAHYHGFEPSKRSYEGLLELGDWLRQFKTGFTFRVENIPFEDTTLSSKLSAKYDLALTSPPYFDTEHYSNEPTQARLRYPSIEKFYKGFYIPMIRKATDMSNGRFVLNIGDRRYPLTQTAKQQAPELSFERLMKYQLAQGGGIRAADKVGETFWLVSK
jgi:hypothetical protein